MIFSHAVDGSAAFPQNTQQFERQRFFVGTYGRHCTHEIGALGGCLTVSLASSQSLSQILQIGDGGIHARYIFVNKCFSLDFSGGLVGNEVLAESGRSEEHTSELQSP